MGALLLLWLYSLASSGVWTIQPRPETALRLGISQKTTWLYPIVRTAVSSTGPTVGLVVLLFMTGPLSTLPAQHPPQPHFRNYSTQHGLPSPETYFAFQDSRGYMWFGTDNGAARFDGYHFKTYGAKEGLTSNVVFDIFEDAKGRIWFGTMTGEAFILEGDTILPYRFNHLVERYRKQFGSATLTALTKEEVAYFELERLGILKIDNLGKDSLFTTERPAYSYLALEVNGSQKMPRTYVERESDKNWVSWHNRRIQFFLFISEKKHFQIELAPYNGNCPSGYNALKLSNGILLITTCEHLYGLKNEEVLWKIPFDIDPTEILEDKGGAIWVGARYGKGLRRYRNVEAIKAGIYDLFFEGISISNFYRDPKDGIWITTLEQGVYYCNNNELITYDSRFGFSEDLVKAVTFKNTHQLFAGCENGDIFQVNLSTNRIEKRITNPKGFHNYDLLYQPEKDVLWSNAAFWKKEQWSLVQLRHPKSKKILDFATSKFEKHHINKKGELLGCNYAGFYIIDVENDTVKFNPDAHNLRERTYAIHTDQQERIWVGNARGIFEFRDSFLLDPKIDHPAFHSRVEDIHEFPDGSLVFGTKGWGVVHWKGKEVVEISTDEGLTSNMIEDVHVDEQGILWVGTLNGLNKITFDDAGRPKVRQFTVANGLPSNEIYKVRSFRGQVWLCTAKGLVRFHEQAVDTVSTAPVLQELIVNGKPIEIGEQPFFRYWENNFTFQFLTINYRQNGNIPYRYRIHEQDDWSYTNNLSVNYARLRWGDYRYEVQSQNEDAYWSPSAIYRFEIRPPWWATGWFISLSGLSFLASGFGFYKFRTGQLKRENRIQQQVTELERAALQAQMNPHFIFNSLNSIQNFILQNDRKQAVEYLSRFAQLVRHNLNASIQGTVSLEEELSLLDNYLALERERFDHRFDYRLHVDKEIQHQTISLPPLLIQPYVENAIIHGLSKKKGKGKVEVNFSRENGHLAVSIRDNGPGYRADVQKNNNGVNKSVGMTITQKRLELLGNIPEKMVQISSLNGKDGASGTEVRILIGINEQT